MVQTQQPKLFRCYLQTLSYDPVSKLGERACPCCLLQFLLPSDFLTRCHNPSPFHLRSSQECLVPLYVMCYSQLGAWRECCQDRGQAREQGGGPTARARGPREVPSRGTGKAGRVERSL